MAAPRPQHPFVITIDDDSEEEDFPVVSYARKNEIQHPPRAYVGQPLRAKRESSFADDIASEVDDRIAAAEEEAEEDYKEAVALADVKVAAQEQEQDEDEKVFRLHSRSVFLTYAYPEDWYANAVDMAGDFYNLFPDEIKHMVIGWEQFERKKLDGSPYWHAHAYLAFHHKKNIKNSRHFDLYDMHPHIKSTKQPKACIAYCSKNAHKGWPYYNDMHVDYSTCAGFARRYGDHQKWTLALSTLSRVDFAFPFNVYGCIFNLSFSEKKRHFWIYGPPDCGKSTNVGADFFDSQSIGYFEPGEQAPGGGSYGTFDTYGQQRLILYDDRKCDWETLQRLCDYKGAVPKNIGIRGRGVDPIFTKAVVVIVLSNFSPGGQKNEDWERDIPAFSARFNVIELEKDESGRGVFRCSR